jgi:hypothetical protein
MTHSVVRRRSAWGNAADPSVDFGPYQPTRIEECPREFAMLTEIILPVESGPGSCRIHHAESDHELSITMPS